MGKPSKNKRGFGCPSFKVVAEALHGSPFTVAMLLDCWSTLFPKQSPSRMQIAMLLRGDAQDAVYLIEHHSTRSRKDEFGRNSIYGICDEWMANNTPTKKYSRKGMDVKSE